MATYRVICDSCRNFQLFEDDDLIIAKSATGGASLFSFAADEHSLAECTFIRHHRLLALKAAERFVFHNEAPKQNDVTIPVD